MPNKANADRRHRIPKQWRTIRRDGLALFNLCYSDGVLATFLRKPRQLVIVRYDPRDMSQVYLRDEEGSYWPIPLSDRRLPAVTLAEIHALLVGGDRQQRIFLNVIRLFANELEMPLVCAGTPEARRALLTDNGLAHRFESVEVRAAPLKASEGVTVHLVRLLERLAVEAIQNGSECISLDSLTSMPAQAPLLSMEHRRRPEASA